MRIKLNKKFLALITAGTLSLTLTACKKIDKSSENIQVSSQSYVDNPFYVNQIYFKDYVPCMEGEYPDTFYKGFSYGDESIKDMYYNLIFKDLNSLGIKYGIENEHDSEVIKNFILDYGNFARACENKNVHKYNEYLSKLISSELFTADFYLKYIPYFDDKEYSIDSDGSIRIAQNNIDVEGLSLKDDISSNVFCFLKECYTIDKNNKDGWIKLFTNVISVLKVSPNTYNVGYEYDSNGNCKAKMYTAQNLLDCNKELFEGLKSKFYNKYGINNDENEIKIYFDSNGCEVQCWDENNNYRILETISSQSTDISDIVILRNVWYYDSINQLISNNDLVNAYNLYVDLNMLQQNDQHKTYILN